MEGEVADYGAGRSEDIPQVSPPSTERMTASMPGMNMRVGVVGSMSSRRPVSRVSSPACPSGRRRHR